MTDSDEHAQDKSGRGFADHAERARVGIVREFWDFLRHSKKWWMTPIIVVLLLVSVLIVLGGTAAGTFIYAFF